jgi:hypothetical protein
VRWEPESETSAALVVPFGEAEDRFTVVFDEATGLIRWMQALRYRAASDETKIPWRLDVLRWRTFHGLQVPSSATVHWLDQDAPWLALTIEDAAYNVDVSQYLRTRER